MISSLSKKITEHLISTNVIGYEDFDLYNYGFFILFSEIFLFVYCLIVGAILKIILPIILFYVFFFVAHRFAGGVHVKTELHCQTITLLFFLVGIVAIKQSSLINYGILNVIYVICAVLLVIFSPADTPQKPLSNKEKTLFKKITSLIVIVAFIAIVILSKKNMNIYASAIIVAIVLQTISVICGRLFNKRLLSNNT